MTNTVQADPAQVLRTAIAAANDVFGSRKLRHVLVNALADYGWEPDHSSCGTPVDQERLDSAARLVHAEHDQFHWHECGHEACRALRDVMGA